MSMKANLSKDSCMGMDSYRTRLRTWNIVEDSRMERNKGTGSCKHRKGICLGSSRMMWLTGKVYLSGQMEEDMKVRLRIVSSTERAK